MKFAIAAMLCAMLSGCSLVGDAVDITSRRSKELKAGMVVSGKGFSIVAPEPGLFPKTNFPTSGGITLRPIEPMLDGKVFFVAPFDNQSLDPSTALDRWNQIPERQRGVTVSASNRRNTVFQGLPAHEAVVDVPRTSSSGSVALVLVIKRGADFLILHSGENYYTQRMKGRRLEACRRAMAKLKTATTITRR